MADDSHPTFGIPRKIELDQTVVEYEPSLAHNTFPLAKKGLKKRGFEYGFAPQERSRLYIASLWGLVQDERIAEIAHPGCVEFDDAVFRVVSAQEFAKENRKCKAAIYKETPALMVVTRPDITPRNGRIIAASPDHLGDLTTLEFNLPSGKWIKNKEVFAAHPDLFKYFWWKPVNELPREIAEASMMFPPPGHWHPVCRKLYDIVPYDRGILRGIRNTPPHHLSSQGE